MGRRAGMAVLWAYGLLHFVRIAVVQSLRLFSSDFLAAFPSYRAAQFLHRWDFYYFSLAERWAGAPPVWHYGPLLHLITLPLFAFPNLRAAFVFWLFVNFAFVASTLWLLARELSVPLAWVVLAALNFSPLYEAVTIRAIEVFELLLLVIAFALYRRGKMLSAGVAIGCAAMCKFLPLIYLPYFALRRQWRALAVAVITILMIATATQFLLRWQDSGTLRQLRSSNASLIDFGGNESIAGGVHRVIRWSGADIDPEIAGRIAILICLAALGPAFLSMRDAHTLLVWWLLAVVMILLPPHNQHYYAVFLLPAYIVLFDHYRRAGAQWSPRAIVMYVSFIVVAVPIPFTVLSRVFGVDVWTLYLRSGLQLAGSLMLVGCCVAELQRLSSSSLSSRSGLAGPSPITPS